MLSSWRGGCDPLFIGGGGVGATPTPRQRSASPLLSTIGSNRLRTALGLDGVDFHHVGRLWRLGGPNRPPHPFGRIGGWPVGPPPTSRRWPHGLGPEWAPFGPFFDSAEWPRWGLAHLCLLDTGPTCHMCWLFGSELFPSLVCFI